MTAFLLLVLYGGIQERKAPPQMPAQAPEKIASLFRYVTDSYVSLRYLDPSTTRVQTLAQDNQRSIDRWLEANPKIPSWFAASKASEVVEALRGWVAVCNDFAAAARDTDKADADLHAGRITPAEYLKGMKWPGERTRRMAKAYGTVQDMYRAHATPTIQTKLAPTSYYMLNGAMLVSTVDGFDFEARLLVPDLGLTASATIANHVMTADAMPRYVEIRDGWLAKKDADPQTVPDYKWYATIKPGDVVLGVRRKGSQDWKRTANWKAVAQAASRLGSEKPEDKTPVIEVLVGRDNNPTRVFDLLSW